MLAFSQEQLNQMAQATFFRKLEEQIEAERAAPVRFSPEQRKALWAAAQDAQKHGIQSIGACLLLCQIFFELGLDCIEKIPAFAVVLADANASEGEKIEALWATRTAMFAALSQE
jgi:hypothetical protein